MNREEVSVKKPGPMAAIICPRCFQKIQDHDRVKFCPRCGLGDVVKVARDTSPVIVETGTAYYRVTERLAVGSITSVYACTISDRPGAPIGIFKIARDSRSNAALENEAAVLTKLEHGLNSAMMLPFLPRLVSSFEHGDTAGELLRRVNVLTYDPAIKSPNTLYTLQEVQAAYPTGLDAKDVAWIWRRLLNILDYVHASGVAHSAVLPEHVLIDPVDHTLVLIGWCAATTQQQWGVSMNISTNPANRSWFMTEGVPRRWGPALDISLGAQCMSYLLKGNITPNDVPPDLEAGIVRHFDRCVDIPQDRHLSAGELLTQFDRLIEALWGPRQYRPLVLPSRY